ncbi:MAG: cysteine desulfurase NifS [Clostridia bacterium]|nr:cysteine desulfurase NifS [Clostridia bacterium]MBR1685886.1 cysteine desulfurase NifS [Clostridia bacterium]MBR2288010.1 cysteine desulfurase NifS [Clostridia bacterium]
MDRIYLDHAGTTPVTPSVLQAMLPYFSECYGNASSIHSTGRDARKAVENARRQVQHALGSASAQEIYFTSGGTESDNWAIKGGALASSARGRHIVTSAIEHHAVLHTCQWLEKQGWEVTYLPVDAEGFVSPGDLQKAMRKDTALVSIMMANNEIGTIEPIAELAEIAHADGALFHTDAVQAVGAIPVDVQSLGVDMLSLSAHKFGGPKGMGALYIKKGTVMERLLHGGEQERHLRAGTENLPGIVGLGEALREATEEMEEKALRVSGLRDRLQAGILEKVDRVLVNGPQTHRLPGHLNLSFLGIQGEALLLRMDLAGIAASAGSACTAGSLDPSHVLMAIGRDRDTAHASLRMTVGRENTQEEIDEVLRILPEIVEDLRRMRL